MNYRMIIYSLGRLLIILAVTMLIPLFIGVFCHEPTLTAFLVPIIVSALLGVATTIIPPKNKSIYGREGYVTAALGWVLLSIVGALPFYISRSIPNFIDCIFETVSGFTTTGATILTDVEHLGRSILFWRSFTHWLGGMGVLVLATAIFSSKDTRTTYVMKAEMPGPTADKLASKWQISIRILYMIYIFLTVLEFVLLLIGGMPVFDSAVHALGTAGTGGFGIKNTSIGFYNNAYFEYVIAIFMMLFAVNFSIYYLLILRRFKQSFKNEELRWFLGMVVLATVVITIGIIPQSKNFEEAFRHAFFQVTSIVSTTGYATADFSMWPMFTQVILVAVMFVGGCVGSTGGGMKVTRFVVLVKTAFCEVKRVVSPRSVRAVKMDGKSLKPDVHSGILKYFVVYAVFMVLIVIIVSFDNFDFTTTVTSVIATVNNIGPGLGMVGPSGNFSAFSGLSKIVLSIGMLAGRLELYPMLALFMPYTWKRM